MATVTTKSVERTPRQVPGYGMSELVRRVTQWHKSNPVLFSDTGSALNLFELPGNAIVTRLLVHITTAFDPSGSAAAPTGTITIPNDTGTEIMWDAANTKLQSSGFSPSTVDACILPDSGGMVIFNFTLSSAGTSTCAAGECEVYLEYLEPEDEL